MIWESASIHDHIPVIYATIPLIGDYLFPSYRVEKRTIKQAKAPQNKRNAERAGSAGV